MSCQQSFDEFSIPNRFASQPPMITVGQPLAMLPPWAVASPILAAGLPPIITVAEAFTMAAGGPTQIQLSPITAAGSLPIKTLGTPGPTIGPPPWGTGTGKAGVAIGQACRSVILAAGGMLPNLLSRSD
jgi:hypothetical protein